MPVPDNINIYRMVHWSNVQYILENGMCHRDHINQDPNYVNIGHNQLIRDRHDYQIPLDGAGTLGEYIPFYYAGHSPMLYLIMKGYQGVTRRNQNDIVFIGIRIENVFNSTLQYIITDRNAKIALAQFYNSPDGLNNLKWEIIQSQIWRNDESFLSRQDYKQAEFLIRDYIPVNYIDFIVVKTQDRKVYFDEILEQLGLNIPVYIDNNCKLYYP